MSDEQKWVILIWGSDYTKTLGTLRVADMSAIGAARSRDQPTSFSSPERQYRYRALDLEQRVLT